MWTLRIEDVLNGASFSPLLETKKKMHFAIVLNAVISALQQCVLVQKNNHQGG